MNTARSALSVLFSLNNSYSNLGSHPLIVKFLKGIYEITPSKPRYKDTWDVAKVLNYIKKQKENSFLSLKQLSMKLCMLMLLSSAQRVQTIFSLQLSGIHVDSNKLKIEVFDKIKQSKPGSQNTMLEFEKFPDKKLCVFNALEEYLQRTDEFRNGTDKLFLCYKSPHGPASKDTLSRWVKDVMLAAGVEDYFGPHSTRSAASSHMYKQGLPIGKILSLAGWSNASTFFKFYYRSCAKNTAQNVIDNYFLKK